MIDFLTIALIVVGLAFIMRALNLTSKRPSGISVGPEAQEKSDLPVPIDVLCSQAGGIGQSPQNAANTAEGFEKVGKYLLARTQGQPTSITMHDLEDIRDRFQSQMKFFSQRENEKLGLAIEHIDKLIAFERAKVNLQTVELQTQLDIAEKYVQWKRLQTEVLELDARAAEAQKRKRLAEED